METLQRTANRGSISTATYEIDNSLKLERANSENIYRQIIDGNRKTWTSSLWIKRVDTATPSYNLFFNHGIYGVGTYLRFNNDDTLTAAIESYGGGTSQVTNAKFRDTSAWMHIVWRVDTTQSTEADRSRIYINGAQITDFSSATYPSQNTDTLANHDHSGYDDVEFGYKDAGIYSNMYYADVYHVDGQSLAPTEFGEYDSASGIWKPIEADISDFGNNGFYLDFSDASSLGTDSAGNGSFTLSNITSADQSTDTPTNNFCTLNPLVNFKYTTNGITEGGTVFGDNTGGGVGGAFGTMAVTAGKWYWEVKLTQQNSHYIGVSAIDDGDNVLSSTDPQEENSTFRFNISAARREYVNSGSQGYGSLDEFTDFHSAGDIIGIALNMDDNQISIYGNGTLQSGVANTTLYDAANKMVVPFHGTINDEAQYNFGGYSAWTPSSAASDANGYGTFEYAPPSGYYALCTKNLAEFGG